MYAVNDASIAAAQVGQMAFAVDDNSVSASDGSGATAVVAQSTTFPASTSAQIVSLGHESIAKVKVHSTSGGGTVYVEGTDYVVDYQAGLADAGEPAGRSRPRRRSSSITTGARQREAWPAGSPGSIRAARCGSISGISRVPQSEASPLCSSRRSQTAERPHITIRASVQSKIQLASKAKSTVTHSRDQWK